MKRDRDPRDFQNLASDYKIKRSRAPSEEGEILDRSETLAQQISTRSDDQETNVKRPTGNEQREESDERNHSFRVSNIPTRQLINDSSGGNPPWRRPYSERASPREFGRGRGRGRFFVSRAPYRGRGRGYFSGRGRSGGRFPAGGYADLVDPQLRGLDRRSSMGSLHTVAGRGFGPHVPEGVDKRGHGDFHRANSWQQSFSPHNPSSTKTGSGPNIGGQSADVDEFGRERRLERRSDSRDRNWDYPHNSRDKGRDRPRDMQKPPTFYKRGSGSGNFGYEIEKALPDSFPLARERKTERNWTKGDSSYPKSTSTSNIIPTGQASSFSKSSPKLLKFPSEETLKLPNKPLESQRPVHKKFSSYVKGNVKPYVNRNLPVSAPTSKSEDVVLWKAEKSADLSMRSELTKGHEKNRTSPSLAVQLTNEKSSDLSLNVDLAKSYEKVNSSLELSLPFGIEVLCDNSGRAELGKSIDKKRTAKPISTLLSPEKISDLSTTNRPNRSPEKNRPVHSLNSPPAVEKLRDSSSRIVKESQSKKDEMKSSDNNCEVATKSASLSVQVASMKGYVKNSSSVSGKGRNVSSAVDKSNDSLIQPISAKNQEEKSKVKNIQSLENSSNFGMMHNESTKGRERITTSKSNIKQAEVSSNATGNKVEPSSLNNTMKGHEKVEMIKKATKTPEESMAPLLTIKQPNTHFPQNESNERQVEGTVYESNTSMVVEKSSNLSSKSHIERSTTQQCPPTSVEMKSNFTMNADTPLYQENTASVQISASSTTPKSLVDASLRSEPMKTGEKNRPIQPYPFPPFLSGENIRAIQPFPFQFAAQRPSELLVKTDLPKVQKKSRVAQPATSTSKSEKKSDLSATSKSSEKNIAIQPYPTSFQVVPAPTLPLPFDSSKGHQKGITSPPNPSALTVEKTTDLSKSSKSVKLISKSFPGFSHALQPNLEESGDLPKKTELAKGQSKEEFKMDSPVGGLAGFVSTSRLSTIPAVSANIPAKSVGSVAASSLGPSILPGVLEFSQSGGGLAGLFATRRSSSSVGNSMGSGWVPNPSPTSFDLSSSRMGWFKGTDNPPREADMGKPRVENIKSSQGMGRRAVPEAVMRELEAKRAAAANEQRELAQHLLMVQATQKREQVALPSNSLAEQIDPPKSDQVNENPTEGPGLGIESGPEQPSEIPKTLNLKESDEKKQTEVMAAESPILESVPSKIASEENLLDNEQDLKVENIESQGPVSCPAEPAENRAQEIIAALDFVPRETRKKVPIKKREKTRTEVEKVSSEVIGQMTGQESSSPPSRIGSLPCLSSNKFSKGVVAMDIESGIEAVGPIKVLPTLKSATSVDAEKNAVKPKIKCMPRTSSLDSGLSATGASLNSFREAITRVRSDSIRYNPSNQDTHRYPESNINATNAKSKLPMQMEHSQGYFSDSIPVNRPVRTVFTDPDMQLTALEAMQDLRVFYGGGAPYNFPILNSPLPSPSILMAAIERLDRTMNRMKISLHNVMKLAEANPLIDYMSNKVHDGHTLDKSEQNISEYVQNMVKPLKEHARDQLTSIYTMPRLISNISSMYQLNRLSAQMAEKKVEFCPPSIETRIVPETLYPLIKPSQNVLDIVQSQRESIRSQWEEEADKYMQSLKEWKKNIESVEAEKAPGKSQRGGSAHRRGLSDIVRSDYEQEQKLEEIINADAKQKRISNGKAPIPHQIGNLERRYNGGGYVHDSSKCPSTTDGKLPLCRGLDIQQSCPPGCNCIKEVERRKHLENPWTDFEKCIFLNQFLNYPKDFVRISKMLKNKTPGDCVAFYYDSKSTVDYKRILREIISRRRGGKIAWGGTISAAKCFGVKVILGDNPGDMPTLILPEKNGSYETRHVHPPLALTSFNSVKRLALNLSKREEVGEYQAGGLDGTEYTYSRKFTDVELDSIHVSPEMLALAQRVLLFQMCPSLRGEPTPFRVFERRENKNHTSNRGNVNEIGRRNSRGGYSRGRIGSPLQNSNDDEDPDDDSDAPDNTQNSRPRRRRAASAALQNILAGSDIEATLKETKPAKGQPKWSAQEKEAFLKKFRVLGKDWSALSKAINTKTAAQIRNYYQNYKSRLGDEGLGEIPDRKLPKGKKKAQTILAKQKDVENSPTRSLKLKGSKKHFKDINQVEAFQISKNLPDSELQQAIGSDDVNTDRHFVENQNFSLEPVITDPSESMLHLSSASFENAVSGSLIGPSSVTFSGGHWGGYGGGYETNPYSVGQFAHRAYGLSSQSGRYPIRMEGGRSDMLYDNEGSLRGSGQYVPPHSLRVNTEFGHGYTRESEGMRSGQGDGRVYPHSARASATPDRAEFLHALQRPASVQDFMMLGPYGGIHSSGTLPLPPHAAGQNSLMSTSMDSDGAFSQGDRSVGRNNSNVARSGTVFGFPGELEGINQASLASYHRQHVMQALHVQQGMHSYPSGANISHHSSGPYGSSVSEIPCRFYPPGSRANPTENPSFSSSDRIGMSWGPDSRVRRNFDLPRGMIRSRSYDENGFGESVHDINDMNDNDEG